MQCQLHRERKSVNARNADDHKGASEQEQRVSDCFPNF